MHDSHSPVIDSPKVVNLVAAIPNRSSDLSRARDANRAHRPDVKEGELYPVTIPEPNKDWHPIAKRLYEAIEFSGQSVYFQDTDWAYAWMLCEEITHYQESTKRSAVMFANLQSGLRDLMFTESERRRARVELSSPKEESTASVSAIADARARLGAS